MTKKPITILGCDICHNFPRIDRDNINSAWPVNNGNNCDPRHQKVVIPARCNAQGLDGP